MMNAKEQLSILWSGLWRMLVFLTAFASVIFVGVWLDPWGFVLSIAFVFVILFSYLIGLTVHGK